MAEWDSLGTINAVKHDGDHFYTGYLIELLYKKVGNGVVFSVGENKEIVSPLSNPKIFEDKKYFYYSANYYLNIPSEILRLFEEE